MSNGESLGAFRLPSRPESPTSLSVASGNAQLTLSWPASSTAGVTYEVQKRDDGAAGVWSAVTRSDSAAVSETVTGLANGTFYEFRVRSVGGDLLTSAWVGATGTPVLAGAPGAPGGLEVRGDLETYEEVGPDRGPGDRALEVQWAAPTGTVTSYDLRYRLNHGEARGVWVLVSSAGTLASGVWTHRVIGLNTGRRYDVQVRAVNATGPGQWTAGRNYAGLGYYSLISQYSLNGFWIDTASNTLWVSGGMDDSTIEAYDLTTKERAPELDMTGMPFGDARSIWGHGNVTYVSVGPVLLAQRNIQDHSCY